jgi:hypothetical protein
VIIAYWFLPLPQPLALPALQPFEHEFALPGRAERVVISVRPHHRTAPMTRDMQTFDELYEVMASVFPNMPAPKGLPSTEAQRGTTVMEVAAVLPQEWNEGLLSEAFDFGVELVNRIQRAYHLATGARVDLLQREKLPMILPMAIRETEDGLGGWPNEPRTYLPTANILELAHPPALTNDQLNSLVFATFTDSLPFLTYADIRREARVALARGDYNPAAVLAATAGEVFLDTALLHMVWEEEASPEQALLLFKASGRDRTLATRVKSDYSPRLGGNWRIDGQGEVSRWYSDTAGLRNRVAHSGYRCSRAEVETSIAALFRLEKYLGDRLYDKLRAYPRTAWELSGGPGLRNRGLSARRITELFERFKADQAAAEFNEWRRAVDALRDGIE